MGVKENVVTYLDTGFNVFFALMLGTLGAVLCVVLFPFWLLGRGFILLGVDIGKWS